MFHGNGGNYGQRLPLAKIFYHHMRCNVLMLCYRGWVVILSYFEYTNSWFQGTAIVKEQRLRRVCGVPYNHVGDAERFSGLKIDAQVSMLPCGRTEFTHIRYRRCWTTLWKIPPYLKPKSSCTSNPSVERLLLI